MWGLMLSWDRYAAGGGGGDLMLSWDRYAGWYNVNASDRYAGMSSVEHGTGMRGRFTIC